MARSMCAARFPPLNLTEISGLAACVPIDFCRSLSQGCFWPKINKSHVDVHVGSQQPHPPAPGADNEMMFLPKDPQDDGTGLGETDEDARVVPGLRARMRATGSNNTNYNKDRHLARISFS